MKNKLNRQQFNALGEMVKVMADRLPAADLEDMLLKAMMQRLLIEMEQRRMEVKKDYKLNWHPERCLAFAAVVQRCTFRHDSYEGNLVMMLYNDIIQKYPPDPCPLNWATKSNF
jgi:hypothetical protein